MTVTIGRRELLAALSGAAACPLAARARSRQSECGGSCSCETARVITLLAILSASRAGVLHGVASSPARQPRMIRG